MAESTPQENGKKFHGIGLEYHQRFKQWWSVARQSEEPPSPCEFLENFGMDRGTVQDLMRTAVKHICKAVMKNSDPTTGPGAIDYFAQHCTIPPKESVACGDCCPKLLKEVMQHSHRSSTRAPKQPTERDLLSLAKVTKPNDWRWQEIIALCMYGNHSKSFLLSMLETMPRDISLHLKFNSRHFPHPGRRRKAFDNDCVLAIKQIMPQLRSVVLAGLWRKESYFECLGALLRNPNLNELELNAPTFIEEEEREEDKMQEDFSPPFVLSPDSGSNPGITSFTIDMSEDATEENGKGWFGVGPWGLQCLPFMSHLKKLEISCGKLPLTLTLAEPFLLQLLRNPATQLRELEIDTGNTADETTASSAIGILEALKENSTVTNFWYHQGRTTDDSEVPVQLYEEKLLKILQEGNTSLVEVVLDEETLHDYNYGESGFSSSWIKIAYYLCLNEHGRHNARDPNTTPEDFVNLLISAKESTTDDPYSQLQGRHWCWDVDDDKLVFDQLNIQYGLLRETPTTWSAFASPAAVAIDDGNQGTNRKRKRQHTAMRDLR